MKKYISVLSVMFLLSAILATVGCKSSDDPIPNGPTITVSLPANDVKYVTGTQVIMSGIVTSGSSLTTLTAKVKFVSVLKSLPVAWAPTDVVITLDGTLSQTITNQLLFSTIPTNAEYGNYTLTLVVADAAGKTAEVIIPFQIIG